MGPEFAKGDESLDKLSEFTGEAETIEKGIEGNYCVVVGGGGLRGPNCAFFSIPWKQTKKGTLLLDGICISIHTK